MEVGFQYSCIAQEDKNGLRIVPEAFAHHDEGLESSTVSVRLDGGRLLSCRDYARVLEDFITTAWMWEDLVCFAIDHGYSEDEIEAASIWIKKL